MSISEPAAANLIDLARQFAQAKGIALSTASQAIYGNQKFFRDLIDGRASITVKNLESVLQKFSNEWPEGTPWPKMRALSMRRPRRRMSP